MYTYKTLGPCVGAGVSPYYLFLIKLGQKSIASSLRPLLSAHSAAMQGFQRSEASWRLDTKRRVIIMTRFVGFRPFSGMALI